MRHIILSQDFKVGTVPLPTSLMPNIYSHPLWNPRLEVLHLFTMGDVFHLLEIMLNKPHMACVAAGHFQAHELRSKIEIRRAHNCPVLTRKPVRRQAWSDDSLHQLLP